MQRACDKRACENCKHDFQISGVGDTTATIPIYLSVRNDRRSRESGWSPHNQQPRRLSICVICLWRITQISLSRLHKPVSGPRLTVNSGAYSPQINADQPLEPASKAIFSGSGRIDRTSPRPAQALRSNARARLLTAHAESDVFGGESLET